MGAGNQRFHFGHVKSEMHPSKRQLETRGSGDGSTLEIGGSVDY